MSNPPATDKAVEFAAHKVVGAEVEIVGAAITATLMESTAHPMDNLKNELIVGLAITDGPVEVFK